MQEVVIQKTHQGFDCAAYLYQADQWHRRQVRPWFAELLAEVGFEEMEPEGTC